MLLPQIQQLQPRLATFLHQFDDCFQRQDTRAHLPVYITGPLSDLREKSVEPLAVKAGVPPRTLQEFLTQLCWDEDQMRDRLLTRVRDRHAGPHAIGIIDETSFVKRGHKTPGVKRQYCGAVGKTENCTGTVHLGFARDDFHCLLDSELSLPEGWSQDRDRCRDAGIPDDMVYRPKWEIGLELYDRAVAHGLHFDWLTFDAGYGGKPDLLRGLTARHQPFVGEVPRHFVGWLKPPRVVARPYHKHRRGRGRKIPRLASGSPPARRVEDLLKQGVLRDQPWQRWRVKEGENGPMVWEVKHARFTPQDEAGLAAEPMHLVVARNVLNPEEVKFFVSNALAETPVGTLLLVGFSRWHVERCFEDDKGEIGLDHYEGRRYRGLKRHLILSAVSFLFLVETRQEFGGEKPGVDGVPGTHGVGGVDPVLVAGPMSVPAVAGAYGVGTGENPAAGRHDAPVPYQDDAAKAPCLGHQAHRTAPLQVGTDLAL